MTKTYTIRVEVCQGSSNEIDLLQAHLKQNGFKKISKDGTLWQIYQVADADINKQEIYGRIKSAIEKIENVNVYITTDLTKSKQ